LSDFRSEDEQVMLSYIVSQVNF